MLIVTQYFLPEPGAPSVRYAAIARTLCELGVRVSVLTAVPNYPTGVVPAGYAAWRPTREWHDGVRVYRAPLFPYGGTRRGLRLLNHLSFSAAAFAGLALPVHPELVIAESPPLPLVLAAAAIARRHRAPLVLYVADLWPEVAIAMGALGPGRIADRARALETWAYRQAWRITVPTDGLHARLAARPDVGPAKLSVLMNGVDGRVFRPLDPGPAGAERAQLGPLADRALFVYAGTIGEAQGLEVIVDAAAALRDDRRIGVLLLGDGPARERLERRAAALHLDNIAFLPAVPPATVTRYLALARAALAPLRDVALFDATRPAKVLPALACGRPVVFGGRGEMAEVILREQCGLVVPPGDAAALAGAIGRLTADPAGAAEMGARGHAFATREFDFPTLVRRWFDELSAARPAPGRNS